MTMSRLLIILAAAAALCPALGHAQTFRCENGVVAAGDSKAEVSQRCGSPQTTDSYCEPLPPSNSVNAKGETVVNVAQCENVDSWTYNPGHGKFLSTLQFRRGKLTAIVDGARVP